jgi:hypothetical protein
MDAFTAIFTTSNVASGAEAPRDEVNARDRQPVGTGGCIIA